MRRSITTVVTLVAAFAGAACEDGPSQTYSVAPTGAAGVWNGSAASGGISPDAATFVGSSTQSFDASVGGQNANDLCTATQEKAIWTSLFSQNIQPPGIAGGIDIAGGVNGDGNANYMGNPYTYDPTKETWTGCTVEQAQKILCQAVATSVYYGVTNTVGWGENFELSALYNTNSRQITDLLIEYGYVGTANATDATGTTYSLSLNNIPITVTPKGGTTSNVLLDWSSEAGINKQVNEIYEAFRYSYNPSFPKDADCVAAGHCIIGNNLSSGGYIWFTPFNLTFFVNNTVAPQPAASTPTLLDLGLLKVLPFSGATVTMKLDLAGEGPTAIATGLGDPGATKTCKYVLGMTFGDFDANCVEPFTTSTANNTVSKAKLFGAISHSDEAYAFDIVGVDPQFTATLAPNAVIADTQRPTSADIAYQLTVDQEVLGPIANDYTNNDATQAKDFHGIGLITLEWANLVQQYMQKNYNVTANIGDADCIANPVHPATAGKVCSGIEGIVTTAPPGLVPTAQAVNALGLAAATQVDPTLGVGIKPGTWYSVFCSDGGGLDGSGNVIGYQSCFGGVHGGYYFDTMQSAVAAVYGTNPIPETLASRRFYFQQWILAVVKYLQTAANPATTLATIDSNVVDPNELFFDSAGGGFETAEYVFRLSVNSAKQAPTALSVTTNLQTSVINDFSFTRYNFRGETALYTALKDNSTDQPGAEPLFITNITGSTVLNTLYNGSYACAISTTGTGQGCTVKAPVDAFGQPLLLPYADAFGQTTLAVGNLAGSAITIDTVGNGTYPLIQSAMVTVPIYKSPTNTSGPLANPASISELLPYLPKGAGVGFPVTIDGSRDKFYNTYNVNFTGATVSTNLDYDFSPTTTADGGVTNELIIRALETQSYLGLVFPCNDGANLLAVRMYQNGQDILNWVTAHQAAATNCGIQIKYSIYGNYADYISFLNTGVRFGLNAGYGGSVVSDVTIFDPSVVPGLGQ